MPCSTGCPTQDHTTWGQCIRAKSLRTGQVDRAFVKSWDGELELYRQARKEGIQPKTTKRRHIEAAMRQSDKTGVAFDAGRRRGHGDPIPDY